MPTKMTIAQAAAEALRQKKESDAAAEDAARALLVERARATLTAFGPAATASRAFVGDHLVVIGDESAHVAVHFRDEGRAEVSLVELVDGRWTKIAVVEDLVALGAALAERSKRRTAVEAADSLRREGAG